jgi:hypothetical protein
VTSIHYTTGWRNRFSRRGFSGPRRLPTEVRLRVGDDRSVTRVQLLAVVTAAAALLAPAALAAGPGPDAHDRALVERLDAKVTTFQKIAAQRGDNNKVDESLNTCAAVKKDPSQAFAAVFAILPALLADLVNEYRPQLDDVRDTLAGMRPHSPLFRQWVTAEKQSFGLILEFDNHGKKIDYCEAATVLLSKKSTAADIRNAIGVEPSLIAKLFSSSSSAASVTLKRVNPKMRPFFRAAGVAPKNVTALTT